MTRWRTLKMVLLLGTVGFLGLLAALDGLSWFDSPSFVSRAEAVVGRPLTPVSVAGVARRTARR